MFDLGWSEMGVIAVVALLVLGPKELPKALRTVTQVMKSARKLANEFQGGINELVREADLEDARNIAQGLSQGSITKVIDRTIDPKGELRQAMTDESSILLSAPSGEKASAPEVKTETDSK